EKIVAVLSVQSTPTLKAALGFLGGFAKALHDGKFAEYAASATTTQLAEIKMESGISGGATSSVGKSMAKQKRSLRKAAPVSKVQITTTFDCEEQTQQSQTKDTLEIGKSANASSFMFEAAPTSPGLHENNSDKWHELTRSVLLVPKQNNSQRRRSQSRFRTCNVTGLHTSGYT
ncbi:hypothetical protein JG688_00014514, partial [Phytophthora aleatoria]